MSLFRILEACVRPRLLVPAVRVGSIRELDFQELRNAGYRGAVFDKDNCLTFPHKDSLVPQLRDAWEDCRKVFRGNVVIVSNSAGTRDDPAGIEAESVSHCLKVRVLPHDVKKPGCLDVIERHFTALGTPTGERPIKPSELIYVGDRLFTDVVMGNKLGGLSIWTTGLWKREAMTLRYVEYGLLRMITAWQDFRQKGKETEFEKVSVPTPQHRFVKPDPKQIRLEPSMPMKIWNGSATGLRLTVVAASWLGRQVRDLYKRSLAAHRKRSIQHTQPHPNEPTGEPSQQLGSSRNYGILSLVSRGMRHVWSFLRRLVVAMRDRVGHTIRARVQTSSRAGHRNYILR